MILFGKSQFTFTEIQLLFLGYCPQFERLPNYMTVKETLLLYARLRGVNKSSIHFICNTMISLFKLDEFEKTLVQKLR
jgi:ABC-type multidrug transport system ATPase subunit